jgi:hypothetical protein
MIRIPEIVTPAVDLDRQFGGCAVEIQNIGTDRVLPAKSRAIGRPLAQPQPKQNFRPSHTAPKLTRSLMRFLRRPH